MFLALYIINLYIFVFMTYSTACYFYDTQMDQWNIRYMYMYECMNVCVLVCVCVCVRERIFSVIQ